MRLDGLGNASEHLRTKRLEGEEALHHSESGPADDDRAGLGERLEPGRHVRGLAHRELLTPPADAHRPRYHRAGVYADPDGDAEPALAVEALVEPLDAADDAEPAVHGPLRVFLVSLGITEVDAKAVAEVLSHVAAEAADGLGARRMVLTHHLPEVLGPEPLG